MGSSKSNIETLGGGVNHHLSLTQRLASPVEVYGQKIRLDMIQGNGLQNNALPPRRHDPPVDKNFGLSKRWDISYVTEEISSSI